MDFGRSRRQRYSSKIFFYSYISKLIFFGLIAFVFLTAFLFILYSRDLPTPSRLSSSNLSQSTRILDRNGIVLYDIYGDQNRTYVELKNIPKTLQQATIAIEDKNFYENRGFSLTGIIRSVFNILLLRGITGGSTLTQQLVKNALLTPERSIQRKIKEFILAIQVDKKYSKDQILELYLNVAPYGGTNVGVETASEQYFGKKVGDLNLVESTILAGLPQRPSFYSPYSEHPKTYINRTYDVLRRMREDGYITEREEKIAKKEVENLKFLDKSQSIKAPHFSFYVKNLLVKQFGENLVEQGGLSVTTTLDYKLQNTAEKITKEEVDGVSSLHVGNGASIVLNPKNGEILSMIGSRDFFATESASFDNPKKKVPFEGQFNVITQGHRQPGSSIKPVMYAAALDKGYTASTLIMDTKTVFPNQGDKDYIPQNYDGKYHGPVQLRFTLGSSLNVPAVKMLSLVGVRNMLSTAYSMGISTLAPTTENTNRFGLSITLGGGEVLPIELAAAYTSFANGGYKMDPISILKVTDRRGNVLFEQKEQNKKRIISPEVAFIISNILSDNNARLITFGENSFLNIRGKTIVVKTGTTDDKRDNWAVGWTPSILVLSWVGNNDNSPMGNVVSGVTGATPIWRRIILEALKDKPNEDFAKPNNITSATIDAYGGGSPVDGKPTRSEFFIKGTEPQGSSPIYQQIKVSKENKNKIASQSEIDNGQYETRTFIKFSEKDPVSSDGKNRWQEGIDSWVNDNYKDDPLYHPPTETSTKVISSPTPTPTPTP